MEKRPIVVMSAMENEIDYLLEKINVKKQNKHRKIYILRRKY